MLAMLDGGGVVTVTPPKQAAAPKPVELAVPDVTGGNTGSASAALQGTTTSGPASAGQSGSLNVPVSEGGPAPNSPTTVPVETVVPTPEPTPTASSAPTTTDTGSDQSTTLDFGPLELSVENAPPPGVGGSFHDLLYAVYTQPPAEHTTLQGVNDGIADLFKTVPSIPVIVPSNPSPL